MKVKNYGFEEERASLHMAVMMSIGFGFQDMRQEARIYAKVLEKYVEYKAGYALKWNVDMEDWMQQRMKERVN